MTISLSKIYFDYHAGENTARALLGQLDWFCRIAEFDPKTGLALPQALTTFLSKVAQPAHDIVVLDRLWRITEHSRASVERLFRSLNENPRRDHALMPVHAVRELDANSFVKLSNRPGRTIREKLAGKPYMQAVRRFQSIDLPENRLLKAFVRRLAELLELRRDYLSHEDDLLPKIQSWLLSDESKAISSWDNLPPNNTLLSHREYRRVWDAWRWLQSLEDDVTTDLTQLEARDRTIRLWKLCAQMWSEDGHLFAEMPILFNYEKFEILPWSAKPPLIKPSKRNFPRRIKMKHILDPVCIDLSRLRARYAVTAESKFLPSSFLWQQWKREDETFDIELFESDAVWLHPQTCTISAPDLFFAKDTSSENFERAARAFASHLRSIFRHDTLIWLAPDHLNDFVLEVIRRNLNARFANAEPLPRSVAAVFAHVNPASISCNGYAIVVLDTVGGTTCATKLIANFDKDLKNRVPITGGYYWERCPTIVITSNDDEKSGEGGYDITTVDSYKQWHDPIGPESQSCLDTSFLKGDQRIGKFNDVVVLIESPVSGGIRLHDLQQRAGDIPLWRNQIPELSIKVMRDGLRQRFQLVSRGTTINPIRGKPVSITINEEFTLRGGTDFYQFPLYIGDHADVLGFSARLNSPAFPLKSDIVCDLNLTFEYGADEPYKLDFAPRDRSFPPARAAWRRTEEIIVTDAPWPEYPAKLAWADLRSFPDIKNGGTMNLIEKLKETSANLSKWISRNENNRVEKSIKGWCRFLVIQLWRDGRTSSEELKGAADLFKLSLKNVLIFDQKMTLDVRFLECCMHKDAPEDCVRWIFQQLESNNINQKRAVGFALGDVSVEWQKDVLAKLIVGRTTDALRVFSYAIWRDEHFFSQFSFSDLLAILDRLKIMLSKVKQCPPEKGNWTIPNWIRTTTEPLELLLGLLRTRSSNDPEIKMLLQPNQKVTMELARQIERITEVIAQSNTEIVSRVQINLQKPHGDRTPDLLYALRLYLTGDDGANAIHISSISDSDND
jgi:hypothetical protein